MVIFIIFWVTVGAMCWVDYMVNYNFRAAPVDYVLGLPAFIILGPITVLRKLMQ